MSRAGDFEIKIWAGGWPVQCTLLHRGERVARLTHMELRDLRYAVERAEWEAKAALPEGCRDEMMP